MIMLQRLRSLKGNQHRSRLYQLKVEDRKGAVRQDEVLVDEDKVALVDEDKVAQVDVAQVDVAQVAQVDGVRADEDQADEDQEVTGVVGEIILEMNRQMNFLKKFYV